MDGPRTRTGGSAAGSPAPTGRPAPSLPGADPDGRRPVAEAMCRILTASDPASLLATAMEAGLEKVGGRAGAVHLLQDDGWLRLAFEEGAGERHLDVLRLVAPDEDNPVSAAALSRTSRSFRAAELARRYPGLGWPSLLTFEVQPLLVDERCLGTLLIELDRSEPLSEQDRRDIEMITTVCAHRLDHFLSTGTAQNSGTRLDQALRLIQGRSRAARLELAMTNGRTGSFDWDFTSGAMVWDERLCRIFGLDPHEPDVNAETFFSNVHPEDRIRVNDMVRRSLETGIYRASYRIVQRDGSTRWIEADGKVVHDTRGDPMGMLGVCQDRTEQHEAAAASAKRQQLLVELTRTMSNARATEDVIDVVRSQVLQGFEGLSTAVYRRDAQSNSLRLLGTEGYEPSEVERIKRLESPRDHAETAALVRELGTGRPLFFPDTESYLARFPDPKPAPTEGVAAAAMLPLLAGTEVVGLWMINYARPTSFPPDSQVAHTAVAGLLGQSLVRAEQADQRRLQFNELQQLMLPRRVPEVPGLETVVRYLPGAEGLEVGGDWYDVLDMPGGRVILTIGDVQGHNAQAAAVMGQVRTSIRAWARSGRNAAELMAFGNLTFSELEIEQFATACMIELDPGTGTFTAVRAGHPNPVMLLPDGTAQEIDVPGGLPLGIADDTTYPSTAGQLPPGGALLMFTDGLVEQPGVDYGDAVGELLTRLEDWGRKQFVRRSEQGTEEGAGRPGPDALADYLVAPALLRSFSDDIAVLLVRRTSAENPAAEPANTEPQGSSG